jgi:tRNA pseudouridine55 synthase
VRRTVAEVAPGVFAVDKPAGVTSHDVVDRVRRALGGAKAGHAGTLDPQATGVLVLCVGAATKISSFLLDGPKEYEGRARLGVTTDTQDATGKTLEERPVTCDEAELRAAAARYRGGIQQIPPMFSAVKIGGQKLYRLARRGVEIERPARSVHVYAFEILHVELPWFEFRIRCSKGTYVRSIVHDLGADLRCGGHLVELRRTQQGPFTLRDALSWETVTGPGAAEAIDAHRLAPAEAFSFLPAREADLPRSAFRVGAALPVAPPPPSGESSGETTGPSLERLEIHGEPVALVRVEGTSCRVVHVFPPSVRRARRRAGP